MEQNFPNWPSRGNFLPYFHRNRFDRQLVDIFSRKISLPRDAWTGTERGGDRTLWSVKRMLHNFDGIYRLRGVAMRFHFLNDIFSRHLFLLLRLLFSSEGKKEKKKGEIRYYRTNNKTCSALYYAWRETIERRLLSNVCADRLQWLSKVCRIFIFENISRNEYLKKIILFRVDRKFISILIIFKFDLNLMRW